MITNGEAHSVWAHQSFCPCQGHYTLQIRFLSVWHPRSRSPCLACPNRRCCLRCHQCPGELLLVWFVKYSCKEKKINTDCTQLHRTLSSLHHQVQKCLKRKSNSRVYTANGHNQWLTSGRVKRYLVSSWAFHEKEGWISMKLALLPSCMPTNWGKY